MEEHTSFQLDLCDGAAQQRVRRTLSRRVTTMGASSQVRLTLVLVAVLVMTAAGRPGRRQPLRYAITQDTAAAPDVAVRTRQTRRLRVRVRGAPSHKY